MGPIFACSCDKVMVSESLKVICLVATKMIVFILHEVLFKIKQNKVPTFLPKYQSVRLSPFPPLKIRKSDFKIAYPSKVGIQTPPSTFCNNFRR